MIHSFELGDTVKTKKKHPCGSNLWRIIRVGADIKLKCLTCGRIVMLDREAFLKSAVAIFAGTCDPSLPSSHEPPHDQKERRN